MWRTTPAWVETWKLTSSPLPTTSSVEPPPTSMTSVGVASPGRALARRAAEGQPRLLVAADDARVEPVALRAHAREEVLAVGGVAHGAREHGDRPLGALLRR